MKKLIFGLGLALSLALLPGLAKAAVTTAPLAPSNNATGYNIHTTLMQWKAVTGKSYKLQIKTGDKIFTAKDDFPEEIGNSFIMADVLKTESMEGLKNDGKAYYWRVRVNEEGAPWSTIYKFTTVGGIQPAVITYPKLVKNIPPTINENAGNYAFTWKNKAGTNYNVIELYKVIKEDNVWKCSGDPIGGKIPVKGEKFSTKLISYLSDGYYCWKVSAYNSGEGVSTSAPGFFYYKKFDSRLSLVSEPLFAQAALGKVIMYWTKTLNTHFNGGAELYSIRVSTSPKMDESQRIEFKPVDINYFVGEKGSYIYDYAKENTGKDLYWQVGNDEVWSKVGKFKSKL